jgi:hypothetical protein
MTNKYLQPFVDDSNYLAEATMAAEEKLVTQKNNRLKQQAYIASSAAHQLQKRPATTQVSGFRTTTQPQNMV